MAAAPPSQDPADRWVSSPRAAGLGLRRSLRLATENVAPLGVGRGRTRRMAAALNPRVAVRASEAREGLWTPARPSLGLGATRIRDLRQHLGPGIIPSLRNVHQDLFKVSKYGEGNGTPLQYSCRKIPWTEEPAQLEVMSALFQSYSEDKCSSELTQTTMKIDIMDDYFQTNKSAASNKLGFFFSIKLISSVKMVQILLYSVAVQKGLHYQGDSQDGYGSNCSSSTSDEDCVRIPAHTD
ncbi:hypothetical protein MG293_000306 [Ovis ammon polii]|uniref:Uncharacterized protein n=1 Tax=Ovis ammon polii TaxID=230172 RepID=A0AAD4YIB6_OVIAM|nr:hypothetical protein MG293_000306 [Ovis ammon polii]